MSTLPCWPYTAIPFGLVESHTHPFFGSLCLYPLRSVQRCAQGFTVLPRYTGVIAHHSQEFDLSLGNVGPTFYRSTIHEHSIVWSLRSHAAPASASDPKSILGFIPSGLRPPHRTPLRLPLSPALHRPPARSLQSFSNCLYLGASTFTSLSLRARSLSA